MSTTGRATTSAPAASVVAARLADAAFVRVVASATGDAIAATAQLIRALDARGIPFHGSVARTAADADRVFDSDAAGGDTVVVSIGSPGREAAVSLPAHGPASAVAFDVVEALGGTPDPILALVGVVSAERYPGEFASILDAAAERIERRPGVGIPTADLADGLSHTTLSHADFSGDETAAAADLAALADDDPRTVASLLALATVGSADATSRAAVAVERALRPHAIVDGGFATVEGYADVLSCLASEAPGTALGLALGTGDRAASLDAWREHAAAAHEAVRTATTVRHDGLLVAEVADAPVETVARLLRDFRSPEPLVLVVGEGEAAAASVGGRGVDSIAEFDDSDENIDENPVSDLDVATLLARTVETIGGTAGGDVHRGYARFDSEPDAFVSAFRRCVE